ncbi:PTS sugar transporter subunit IIC [Tetragenococcus halophilus]|uniref:Permease IIC component n=1 Tax=Tetragenococcus halophilus subsp. halophilus TaxID=1513897 RepID=A0A2H6DK17_TETHA|nr:PTS transporter subunit EIIC [Tetragenococcus halophilus]MCF1600872.1 PTS transporter subunit EIIC [Tetragenococcus halophilus]MCF1684782.1 PTS transporter subunit EIIC [Tetragenococcus halophilus]MCO8283960.1 PTS sugar transporter subunit IIC [Tetragenococcus halophilus]GBD66354.1 putative phosphotransferase system enzyme IIC component [Tetragenococcus halophilus subsp. halophilus]GBD67202.1 putative phosphotransferase system enzyme IIC component [Tetragenococcus halophilus subsp. halophil
MLDKFTQWIEKYLGGPMANIANQRHLRAVRDGIIAALPLIIVGSFFMIVAFPPLPESWGITQFLTANAETILLPYRMSMYIMALYATFGIGASLSKSYDLDQVAGGILAVTAFLLTLVPVSIPEEATEIAGVEGFVLPMANLGGEGMFVGIVTSIIAVEIYRLTDKSNFKITMPDQVPPAVARSFEALTPTLIVILLIGSITYYIGFDWHAFIGNLISPLISAADSLPSVLLLVLLTTFFWFFGIHGLAVIGSIARPLWLQLLESNSSALATGEPLPTIGAEPFYQWFIWIGGAGATIGLAILLAFRSKSQYGSKLGKTILAPAIFNINEPVIFGVPIVLNPILMVPFIGAPIVLATIAWFATSLGLVNAVTVTAPWTLPGPIGAFLATNGDWRAAVLNIILIIIAVLIYYPFFRVYDKNELAKEQGTTEG